MTITVTYEARCDFCYATYSMGRIDITTDSIFKLNFVEQLRHEGWTVATYVTCPDCEKDGRNRQGRKLYDTEGSIALSRQQAEP